MKLKTLPPLFCLIMLITPALSAQTRGGSQTAQKSDYGIDAEKLYPGNILLELLQTADTEIDNAVSEAYAEGYKAGLLESAPDAAYWQRLSESLRDELKAEKKKTFRARFLFGVGGFVLGVVSMGVYSIARQ
jgi:hypothetical protein